MTLLRLELCEAGFERCHQLTNPGKATKTEIRAALAALLRDHSRALAALSAAGVDVVCPAGSAVPPRARSVRPPELAKGQAVLGCVQGRLPI